MIVSHKHRFIFLKVRRTAGTSIEVALSRVAGDDAIVTPIPEDEPGHRARNHQASWQGAGFSPAEAHRKLREANRDLARSDEVPYFNHMPARLVKAKLGEEIWNSYFKFCFERNPWEKVASMYGWHCRNLASPPTFEEWLYSRRRNLSDRPIYTLDGACAVDAVGRYETLTEDLRTFAHRVGIASADQLDLPQLKSGFRREVRYSSKCIERIGRIYHREIEMFSYECPPSLRADDRGQSRDR